MFPHMPCLCINGSIDVTYNCIKSFGLVYLGLSGLGGLSMKLLLVALEMGITGIFFNKDEGSKRIHQTETLRL